MFFDDLPIWGFVGTTDQNGRSFLYTHVHFSIKYNDDRVIGLNISTNGRTVVDVSRTRPSDQALEAR